MIEIIMYILIWWISGIIFFIVGSIVFDKKLSIKDILNSLLWGLLGWILILVFIVIGIGELIEKYKVNKEVINEFIDRDLLNYQKEEKIENK